MNTTDTNTMLHDRHVILQSLAILAPDGVVELRALDVPDGFGLRVVSGYFDVDHRAALVEAVIKQCPRAGGVYITLQHVRPDCLARCANRARTTRKSDPTTRDEDVLGYRWLPLDFDPARPAGVSSNEEEHEAALSMARSTRDALTAEGWPEPVMIDSGNGAHLLYKLPLGWGSSERVQKTLKLLSARFSTARVLLDEKVFNPARIWKLPGSVARKGDSIPSRPHRLSRLLAVPETIEALSLELLDRVLVVQSTPEAAKATPHLLSTHANSSIPSSVQTAEKSQPPTPPAVHKRSTTSARHDEASAEKIESALAFINSDERDTWLCVGEALHHWNGPDARGLWDRWSMSSSKFDPEQQDKTWNSFRSEGRNGKVRTVGSIFYKATQAGWQNPDRRTPHRARRPSSIHAAVGEPNTVDSGSTECVSGVRVKSLWPDAPVSEDALMPKNYLRTDEGLAKRIKRSSDDEERVVVIAPRPVFVIARQINMQKSEFVRLSWPRVDEWRQFTVSRNAMIDKKRAMDLGKEGCPITTFNAGSLTQWLADYEELNIHAIPAVHISDKMGWHGDGLSRGFLLGDSWISSHQDYTTDPEDPLTWNRSAWTFDTTRNSADSDSIQAFKKSRGSFKGWCEAVQSIVSFPRVLLALYASFAAPLVEVLQSRSIIIDWSGPSGTGKTTALGLAASVWANPDEVAGSFVKSWSATMLGIEHMASFANHLPLILNDSNKAPPWLLSKVAYELAEGSGKTRGTRDGGLQTQQTWRTVILSSGEQRLAGYADNPDAGVSHRIIQLHGETWGGCRPDVQRLRNAIRDHYGHAGRLWLQWVVAHRSTCESLWRSRQSSLADQYVTSAPGCVAVHRLGADLATIQLAAELVHDALDLPWSVDIASRSISHVFDFLTEHTQNKQASELALGYVWDWCIQHQNLFAQNDHSQIPPQGWAGRWDPDSDWQELVINPGVFRKILQDNKFQYDTVLREWADVGWIRRGDGRNLLAHVSIRGKRSRYVVIKRSAIEQVCLGSSIAEH